MTTEVMPSSRSAPSHRQRTNATEVSGTARTTRYLAPLGRLLFSALFLLSVPMHFTADGIAYAAASGTPWPEVLVPLSGVLLLLGGLSVLFGYHARIGALLLALFLVPVTLIMHAFWAVPDPAMAQVQQIMFMKNVSLLGATLLIMHCGAGSISLDALRGRR